MHYYNEFDPKAAGWLRELIRVGVLPPGDVDERSITDVQPDDLAGYRQCHFFAGIGGWPFAARLAGWPDDRELWTGSPPCQPFSVAGKGLGAADARHLWPDLFRLIRARRPACFFGEQVAAAIGKDWFIGVRSDLESAGYVGRGFVIPACAVNAPHRRDRLWFVARSGVLGDGQREGLEGHAGHEHSTTRRAEPHRPVAETGGGGDVADSNTPQRRTNMAGRNFFGRPEAGRQKSSSHITERGDVLVADNDSNRCGSGNRNDPSTRHRDSIATTSGASHWHGAKWLIGHDGKARRVESSIPLLVDGLPNRAPLLRGYGNAIVPQVAAEIMSAYLEEYPA